MRLRNHGLGITGGFGIDERFGSSSWNHRHLMTNGFRIDEPTNGRFWNHRLRIA